MLCLDCGAEMHLVQVTKDTTMLVSGYEHHTWQCSGCSATEQRMTFTREKTSTQTVPAELTQTALAEPAQSVSVESTQATPVEPSQTTPVETTPPVEAIQTVPAELTIQNRQPPPFQKNAWAKALKKVQKQETASETERRAEFNRFWDKLLSVPPPSASSKT